MSTEPPSAGATARSTACRASDNPPERGPGEFAVIARNSTFAYTRRAAEAMRAAKKLGGDR